MLDTQGVSDKTTGPMARLFFRSSILLLILLAPTLAVSANQGDVTKPNILLIVVDDMGFSDLGAFGGDIPTPNLDQLARAGTRFTDFQVMPACSLTRAALFSGADPHKVGFGSLEEEIAPSQRDSAAYQGYLPADLQTLPRLLQGAGYRTLMAGKWHLGFTDGRGPRHFGFDQSFAMLSGGASHFVDAIPAYATDEAAIAPYAENDQLLTALPVDFIYSSQFYVDQLLRYMEASISQKSGADDTPFFGYLSFTAPHWPLQAPDAAIAQFAQRYSEGYEVLRQRRFEQMKAEAVIPATAALRELPSFVPKWSSLTPAQQQREARAMAVYAAMIAEIDVHVGRLITSLKASGDFDNTLIVFFSDNGAEGHDLDQTWPADLFPEIRAQIDARFNHATQNMGRPGSYTLYGPGWADAAAPHLRLFKAFPSEGGTRVAAFAHWPGHVPKGILAQTLSVKDVFSTVLAAANIDIPVNLKPEPEGFSFLPALIDDAGYEVRERILGVEFLNKKGLRRGHWKLLQLPPPYGTDTFELFNLRQDLAEQHNVAKEHPQVFAEMKALYAQYSAENGVIEPDWVSGY